MRFVMRSKIHRATVTHADVDYVGSISIDENILQAAGIEEWEKIHVLDVTNGSRLETYVVKAPAGSGKICINGAAAHLVHPGDLVILITYEGIPSDSVSEHLPTIVHVNTQNEVIDISQEIDAVEYVEVRP
ncbi:MAG TPA: aspartate 1-decarboxylase [Candidatus Thalassarchaeaceae archaeon]|nr:aspartate 1-decarboxylase [Candidatus Thalassarchaeaceae archaeon]HJM41136.1 aspartate 1-decarboxylase [Candidatus Thalassarchaeaceae archaeon]